MQRRGKHASKVIKALLETMFSIRSMQSGYKVELSFGSSVVRRWPARNDVSAEAEECPLLEAVANKTSSEDTAG
jgi:hypothetical protein